MTLDRGDVETRGRKPERDFYPNEKAALREASIAFFPKPDRLCEFCGCHAAFHQTTIRPTDTDIMMQRFGVVTEESMVYHATMINCLNCAGKLRTPQVVCWKRKENDDEAD